MTYTWKSLKPVIIEDIYIKIGWAIDRDEQPVCSRVDIRYYANGNPTRYGVVLKSWELTLLETFIKDHLSEAEDRKKTMTMVDLHIEKSPAMITVFKSGKRVHLPLNTHERILSIIPGVVFILKHLKKPDENDNRHVSRLLDNIFMFSQMMGGFHYSITHPWPEEEIINDDCPAEVFKLLKNRSKHILEDYNSCFADMINLLGQRSCHDLEIRIGDNFLKELREFHSESGRAFRSLVLIFKSVLENIKEDPPKSTASLLADLQKNKLPKFNKI